MGDVVALAERVAASIAAHGGVVERAVFSTVSPGRVAAAIEAVAPSPVVECRFYVVSVGCVAGLTLADGTDVVVKAHQPRWTAGHLRRAVTAQAACADAGLAAPRPLAGPLPCGNGLATVEAYLPDPGDAAPTAEMLEVSAAGLAAVIDVTGRLDLPEVAQPLDRPPGQLYPQPHSPLFDFAATHAGAEWIDDLARRSLAARDAIDLPRVVTHTDWAARNVRFDPTAVRAIYDWDSIAATTEAAAVGLAAQTWRSTGRWDDTSAPGPDEVVAYLDAYGHARGRPLTRHERRAAAATALWVLAYSARCEHSVDATGPAARSTNRLRTDADRLLHLT
jgi:hypothetical protein